MPTLDPAGTGPEVASHRKPIEHVESPEGSEPNLVISNTGITGVPVEVLILVLQVNIHGTREVRPVPPLATGTVPLLDRFLLPSVNTGKLAVNPDNCKLVPVAAPITGVTKVGLVARTLDPVTVLATLTKFLLPSVPTANGSDSQTEIKQIHIAVSRDGRYAINGK